MRKWCGIWRRGQVQPESAQLYGTGLVAPMDLGPHPEVPTKRKLRPVGLCDSLLKVHQATLCDEE